MNQYEKKVVNQKIIKDLRAEIVRLEQENRLLKKPLNQIEYSFPKLNEILREIIHDGFYFVVDMACTGIFRVYFRWDEAETERYGVITNRSLRILIGYLEEVDWDAEIQLEFDERRRLAIAELDKELAVKNSIPVNSFHSIN